ncbi:hypothetical protein [Methylocucumis oryzae]|uniref:Uncharacterized protein n=1 Tax=Methylocucumis oryzae TaxID=1632867 RepID=A0A0F3II47_9GAMM|nr:hypothetical protein [Methylocucumis oryzae]KJV05129.1 hypothetical protein VZ94_20380 [Methylocucumis oryzae]
MPTIDLPILSHEMGSVCDKLLVLVPELHRTKKTVQSALESFERRYGFDYVRRNILYSNVKADKSYAGFLNNALKEDWGHDWELEQQNNVPGKNKAMTVWERQGFSSQKEYDEHMYKTQMQNYGIVIR